jgi:hypothetical protein
MMKHIIILTFLWVTSCAHPQFIDSECPYDVNKVLTQAGWKDVVPLQVVRWRQMKDDRPLVVDEVVILGKRGNKFLLMSAYKHPVGGHNIWNRTEKSVMFDWGDDWIIGEDEYETLPSEKVLKEFLSSTGWDDMSRFQIVFEGKIKIKKPTTQ